MIFVIYLHIFKVIFPARSYGFTINSLALCFRVARTLKLTLVALLFLF